LLVRLDRGDAGVLDVRPEPEYAGGHIPGATHIPLDELTGRFLALSRREIVAYCRRRYCVLALDSVPPLSAHGLNASRATDSVQEWRLAGLRFERPAPPETLTDQRMI